MPGSFDVEEFGFGGVGADDVASGAIGRDGQELGNQVAREPDGMAAAAVVSGHADTAGAGEQGVDRFGRDGRVIDQSEQDAIGSGRNGAQARTASNWSVRSATAR